LRLERDNIADHAQLTAHREHQAQALCQIGRSREACRVAERAREVCARCRVENRLEPHAGVEILPGEKPKQRPAARKHRAALRHQPRRLEKNLRAARRHDARQRPTRDRERPLDRAGRKDHALGLDEA
jgi:hypothetical protein